MKRVLALLLITVFVLSGCSQKTDKAIIIDDDGMMKKGRIIVCDNGSYLFIDDGGPIELRTKDESVFNDLTSGDLVSVILGLVEESYPGRADLIHLDKLEDGELLDINAETLESLEELGWIEKIEGLSSIKSQRVSYEHAYANMSLVLPEGWMYSIDEYTDGCSSFGIKFRPDDAKEGWMELCCYTYAFAVCGTGLECEESEIGDYNVSIGRYDGKEPFDYIVFKDLPGEYVVINFSNVEWFDNYSDEIMAILNSVKLGENRITLSEIGEVLKLYDVDVSDSKVGTYFDVLNGRWEITIPNGSSDPWYINFDSKGKIIDSNYIITIE